MNGSSPQSNSAPRLYLHLLGSLAIIRNNEPIHFPTRKIEALLAYLALHPEAQAREKLATLFWGDVSDQLARVSLRYALGQLRKTLGSDLLSGDREVVRLKTDFPIWVDAREFRQIADRGWQNAATELPIRDMKDAISHYRGDLLADFYDDWIFPEREHFRQLYLDVLLQLTQQYRAQSEYAQAIETAQRVLKNDPADERAHQHLIFCFVAQGDRHAALQQYEQCLRALYEELAIDPAPETTALYEWIKQTHGESISPAARITNLPIPLTSFIGRGQEMAQVKAALAPNLFGRGTGEQVRLLTLIGAGGSGKTRLAIQSATDLIDAYKDGVWWVELAALADGALVPSAVANALGVRESPQQPPLESLTNFLRGKQLLLVLDNCEHMLDACAQLARALLGGCAKLQILATSREPLGFIGETVLGVLTLAFPDPNAMPLTDLLVKYEAIRLFIARATAVNPHFELTAQNASAVAQICAHLDGIPLALELAAARVKELAAEEIAARLDDRFSFLNQGNRGAIPRHQTLRALFDWSFALLTERERVLFRRVAVFAGGWTLAAAESICAGRGITQHEVQDLLSSLQDKSLVAADERSGHSRRRLLETVRAYAEDKLIESGESEQVRDSHLAFFLQMAEEAELEFNRSERGRLAAQFEEDLDNVRAAIRRSLTHQPEAGLRLVGALIVFWSNRGHIKEGQEWAEQVLAASGTLPRGASKSESDPPVDSAASIVRMCAEAKTLIASGFLAFIQGDYATAQSRLEAAQVKARATGDPRIQCDAQNYFGTLKLHQGDALRARALHERSVVLAREMGDVWMLAYSLWFLGDALTSNEPASARRVYEESLALFRQVNDPYFRALPMASLAHIAAQEGNYVEARALLEECLAIRREDGHEYLTVIALNSLAEVMCYQGDYENAALLSDESLTLSRTVANKSGIAWALRILGDTVAGQGDAARAQGLIRESLELYRELGHNRDAVQVIESLAEIAITQERHNRAAMLWGAADALRESFNIPRASHLRSAHDRNAANQRAERGGIWLEPEFSMGYKLTLEQAIELALSD